MAKRKSATATIEGGLRKRVAAPLRPSHPDTKERGLTEAEAMRDSERMARGVVDGLTAHIAVVDERGCILSVNARWRDFAVTNDGTLLSVCEGANYLEVCRKAARGVCAEASLVANGIQEVLVGKRDHFAAEYPCHSPTEQRWFIVQVTRLAWEGPPRALIAHENITARVQAERALRESEDRYRQLIHGLPVAMYTCDAQGRILLYNAAAAKLWGREPKVGQERWGGAHQLLSPDGHPLPRSRWPIALAMSQDEPIRDVELIVERPDGSRSHVLVFPDPIHDAAGVVVGAVNVMVEITALKLAENALRTSERNLRKLSRVVEQSPTSVLITDPSGAIDYVNPRFTEVTGYSQEEVMGRNPRLLKSGENPPELYREMWEAITAGRVWRGSLCNRKKDGTLYWEFAVIAPIHDRRGAISHFVSIKEDITERRKATTALQESEARLRAILNTVTDAVITIDPHGIITGVNPATARMFGYAEKEMLGQEVSLLMPPLQHEDPEHDSGEVHRPGFPGTDGGGREVLARRKDGSIFPVDLAVSEVRELEFQTGVVRDITERKRLEAEVLRIAESERMRVAADLHDGICQELVGTQFVASALRQDLENAGHPLAARAARIADALSATANHTRDVARGMNPVVADGSGLMYALRRLAEMTSLRGIRCVFQCPAPVAIESPVVANELYRIAQEAVQNAVRHSRARRITVQLSATDGEASLLVTDNGLGLAPGVEEGAGMGLRVMRYRASGIGGQLALRARKPSGTAVICRVPQRTS